MDESAIDTLMTLLGKSRDPSDNSEWPKTTPWWRSSLYHGPARSS
jgi:hypothetical protein